MQDNLYEPFDRQLRSMLSDAEVKPSRRVWKGVSSRLDAASAPAASPWAWMKWAGMSLAAAAAIAAGVFFNGTRDTSIPTIIHNQEQATTLAQAGDPAGAPVETAAPAAAPATGETTAEVAAPRSAFRRSSPQQPATRPAEGAAADPGQRPDPESPVPAEAEQPQAEPASGSGQPAKAVTRPATVRDEPFADPFADPDAKPVRRSGKSCPALYAQGAVGSNDAGFRPAAPGAWMAPGEQPGLSELGASSFGVPFTLGVGVRFYVAPRLSVGTGLDYSLLTRTFTGSLDGTSGSVSHTLQYLGIPVHLYYDIVSTDRIKFYAYGGGEAEWAFSNKYRLFDTRDIVKSYPVQGLQYSVGAGLGIEFGLSRRLGIYVDPGVNYYFPGNQPRSIRTEKPLLLNFDAGLRFNF